MGFLYFLLALFIIGFLFQLFFRYVLPYILYRHIKKKQKESNNANKSKEGEVRIKKNDNIKNHVDPEIGEYIDFEELDNEND